MPQPARGHQLRRRGGSDLDRLEDARNSARLAQGHPERTVFTCIPPVDAESLPGAWRDYYRHWRAMTRERLDERLLGLVPPLGRLVPPAVVCDKPGHSAFANPSLLRWLSAAPRER